MMQRTVARGCFTGLLCVCSLALAACGGGASKNASSRSEPSSTLPSSTVVANVGGHVIDKATVDHWIAIEARAGKSIPSNKLRQRALDYLITAEWITGGAAEKDVHVSDREVAQQFAKLRAQQFPASSAFRQFLTTTGESVADLMLTIRMQLTSAKLRAKLTASVRTPTQADIAKYYMTHRREFVVPAQREVAVFQGQDATAAKKVLKAVHDGKSFEKFAHRVAVAEPRNANPALTPRAVLNAPGNPLDEAIFAAKPNILQGPIHTYLGYYLFELKKTSPPRQVPRSRAEALIRRQLPVTQQKQALTAYIKAWRAKWIAKTDCRANYVTTKCRQYKRSKSTPVEDPFTLN